MGWHVDDVWYPLLTMGMHSCDLDSCRPGSDVIAGTRVVDNGEVVGVNREAVGGDDVLAGTCVVDVGCEAIGRGDVLAGTCGIDVGRKAIDRGSVVAGICVLNVKAIDECCNVVDGSVGEGSEAVDDSPSVSFARTEVSELGSG